MNLRVFLNLYPCEVGYGLPYVAPTSVIELEAKPYRWKLSNTNVIYKGRPRSGHDSLRREATASANVLDWDALKRTFNSVTQFPSPILVMPHTHSSLILSGTLFSASVGVSLLASPPVVAFCQSKSTRLAAVVGALVLALGVLFTSFAVEFSQLYCSFGIVIGERH